MKEGKNEGSFHSVRESEMLEELGEKSKDEWDEEEREWQGRARG